VSSFSPEQEEIIQSWGTGMAVLAGAGSGKTTTLVAKCAQLVQLDSTVRFAAVSFTERSASDLKSKLTTVLLRDGKPTSPHWITTIHGLCAAVLREFPREAGLDGEEVILTEPEAQLLWNNAMDSLWLDELHDEVRSSLEILLDRESRDGLAGLIKRVRDLSALGVNRFLGQSSDPATLALEKVSKYVIDRFNRQKRRQGVLDFGDLESAADLALNSPVVQGSYHRRFELVLVDEFQDTNPLQARIIRKFARPDASNLCVVGDPKQSIYRFRDADVSVFEEFCSQLPLQKSLTWNFRSVEGIIQFTNNICSGLFEASNLRFDPLIPKRGLGESSPVCRLNIKDPSDLGKWLQGEIRRGAKLDDFALLLRKIRGNEKWIKALNAAGIPVAVGSGGLFWEDPRIRELVSFLKWWDNPANALSGGIFLRAPWMKSVSEAPLMPSVSSAPTVTDVLLDEWNQIDPTWRKPFFESGHPVALKLKPLLGQVIRPGELLLALLDLGGAIEAELSSSILGLWHRVEEFSSRGMDFHTVVMEISKAMKDNRREREVPAPRNLGQLTILTLHGAKGLEFPTVILLDFDVGKRSSDAPLLFWDRNDGAYLGRRDEDGNRDIKNPTEKIWRDSEKRKSLAESKRLFYVALTRARERLVLVCPGDIPQKDYSQNDTQGVAPRVTPQVTEEEKNQAFKSDDWRGWIETCKIPDVIEERETSEAIVASAAHRADGKLHSCFASPFSLGLMSTLESRAESSGVLPGNLNLALSKKRPRHSVTEWNLLSRCPRSYEWTYIRPRESSSKNEPESDSENEHKNEAEKASSELSKRESFQELGNQVHSCLAREDYAALSELEKLEGVSRFSSVPVIKWAQNSHAMKPGDSSIGRDVWVELPFEVPIAGEILVGSMDRVILEKGDQNELQYSIIDFKVTEKPKNVDLLLEAYQTQIILYATALKILEPSSRSGQINTSLVNITTAGVQIVPVFLDSNGYSFASELAKKANEIVNGASGAPKTGPLCRFCEFREQCPEGAKSLRKSSS